MASIKLGAIVTEISGKLGGHVFSKDVNGHYLRTKIKPPNPQSAAQSKYRSMFKKVSTGWGGLTIAQRKSFADLVGSYKKTNIFGDLKNPTAKALYQRLNNNLLITDQPLITTCLPPAIIVAPVLVSSSLVYGVQNFYVNFSDETFGSKVIIYTTFPLASGIVSFKKHLRVIGTLLGNISTFLDITALYGSIQPIPLINANLYIGVVFVNSQGQASSIQVVKAEIT